MSKNCGFTVEIPDLSTNPQVSLLVVSFTEKPAKPSENNFTSLACFRVNLIFPSLSIAEGAALSVTTQAKPS